MFAQGSQLAAETNYPTASIKLQRWFSASLVTPVTKRIGEYTIIPLEFLDMNNGIENLIQFVIEKKFLIQVKA